MPSSDVTRLDTRHIPDDPSEIRLFAVMKNESLRVPYFLRYYRRLGVKRFFIIDNDSDDGMTEYLLQQPDCAVFHTKGSYADSRAGLAWLNPLMDLFGANRWVILADADELFVYPGSEGRPLDQLCDWLDRHHYEGVSTLLLDMYSDKPLQEIMYTKGNDFLEACRWYDRHYHFVRRFGLPFFAPACPKMEPIGGPRLRLCFPSQNTPSLWPRLRPKLMHRLQHLVTRLGLNVGKGSEPPATQAFKVPLVRWQRGYAFVTSHRLNRIRLAPLTGALLHFKYFQDFSARVREAIKSKMHYDGSSEYRRYGQLLTRDPSLSMMYAGSVQYRSSQDLVQQWLIRTDPEWEMG